MLNYHLLSKEQRCNSYIENYNRRIKLKLSKYLYGKNKCKISWPLFLYFIKQEEQDYRTDIYNKEKELTVKYRKIKKFIFSKRYLYPSNFLLFISAKSLGYLTPL